MTKEQTELACEAIRNIAKVALAALEGCSPEDGQPDREEMRWQLMEKQTHFCGQCGRAKHTTQGFINDTDGWQCESCKKCNLWPEGAKTFDKTVAQTS